MSEYRHIETRAMDIIDINGHLINHANHLMNSVYDLAIQIIFQIINSFRRIFLVQERIQSIEVLLSKSEQFFAKDGKAHQIPFNIKGHGDQRENFKREIRNLLQERPSKDIENPRPPFLDMESFETLYKMPRSVHTSDTIGGAPQMIKAYQYMNSCPASSFCSIHIYWNF